MYFENEFGDTIQGDVSKIDYSCDFIVTAGGRYFKRTKTLLSAKRELNKYRGKRTIFVQKNNS